MGRQLQINGETVEASENQKLKDVLTRDDVPGSPDGQVSINRDGEMFSVDKDEPVEHLPEDERISVGPSPKDGMLG